MNLPDYFLRALFESGAENDQLARIDDTLSILTQQLVEEILDDLFDIKKSSLLRWTNPENVLKNLQQSHWSKNYIF